MRKYFLLLFSLIAPLAAQAQEVFVNADLVSSYIWRGMKCGNASIQPTLGASLGGFTLSAWGSTEFRKENNEIDLSLEYEFKGWRLNITNYFVQNEDEPFKYFNYNSHSTGHTFEAGVGYTFNEKFPLSVSWYTVFSGNDYHESGKRAWSSYCELSYPLSVKEIELAVEAGFSPWEGEYTSRFNVVNIGLSATKRLNISDHFSLPLFAKLVANPYEEQVYFVIGINL